MRKKTPIKIDNNKISQARISIGSVASTPLLCKKAAFLLKDQEPKDDLLKEVSQIARSISRVLGLDEDLSECLALAHDLGHPPFGHSGEDALSSGMLNYGGFDHNANTLRIVEHIEGRYAEFDGLNLTWETLEGIAKHNGPLIKDKSYKASEELAKLFGEPAVLKGYGRRNTTLNAIAPTTSSAFILGQVSQGIEPIWSNSYVKDIAKIKTTIKNPFLVDLLEEKGQNTTEVWRSIRDFDGSVQHLDFLSENEKEQILKTIVEHDTMDLQNASDKITKEFKEITDAFVDEVAPITIDTIINVASGKVAFTKEQAVEVATRDASEATNTLQEKKEFLLCFQNRSTQLLMCFCLQNQGYYTL